MNAPRSAAHAGSRAPSASQVSPATLVSKSSSLVSATLGRIKQDVFPRGLAQIFPVQRLSCHGTRTDTCRVGSCLAPLIIPNRKPQLVASALTSSSIEAGGMHAERAVVHVALVNPVLT